MKRVERLYAVGQLSAGLAHEIRNPLASIAGAVGIIERNGSSESKRDECLNIIKRETERLNRLLTSFLDFARPRPPQYQSIELSGHPGFRDGPGRACRRPQTDNLEEGRARRICPPWSAIRSNSSRCC